MSFLKVSQSQELVIFGEFLWAKQGLPSIFLQLLDFDIILCSRIQIILNVEKVRDLPVSFEHFQDPCPFLCLEANKLRDFRLLSAVSALEIFEWLLGLRIVSAF